MPRLDERKIGETSQRTLFPSTVSSKTNNGLKDPAFFENKKFPIHRWIPWIAGFSASFVDSVFDSYLNEESEDKSLKVLDPFAGVGTTILQSVIRGYDAIGFEINPYASLAARTKAASLNVDIPSFKALIEELPKLSRMWRNVEPVGIKKPPLKTKIAFFSPKVERQVLHALGYINDIEDDLIRDIFRTAFGAVIVSVSNYSYEPSLCTRKSAGKPFIEDVDFAEVLAGKFREMLTDIKKVKGQMGDLGRIGKAKILTTNFLTDNDYLANASINLLITSPPYLNNYHYVRNTRPQLYWLSFISAPEDHKNLETGNFGKYWQEVRDLDEVRLSFEHSFLNELLGELRGTRKSAGAYGGPGWANYVASYFNDTYGFYKTVSRVLKTGGYAVVVVGNSIIQGIEIEVDRLCGDIARRCGLEIIGIEVIRDKRIGSSITASTVRRNRGGKRRLYDAAVIVKKAANV